MHHEGAFYCFGSLGRSVVVSVGRSMIPNSNVGGRFQRFKG